jgi:hypothetical protein
MRWKAALIFVAAICLLAVRGAPHDGYDDDDDDDDDDHHPPAAAVPIVPSNGTTDSANPKTDYVAPVKGDGDMDMDGGMGGVGMDGMDDDSHASEHTSVAAPISPDQMSYWLWPEHRGLLYAHICIMVISWGFLLPVGIASPQDPPPFPL